MKPNSSHMLISKGFTRTLLDLFPAIEWTSENKSVFIIVLERAFKLFKKVQVENQVHVKAKHYFKRLFLIILILFLERSHVFNASLVEWYGDVVGKLSSVHQQVSFTS